MATSRTLLALAKRVLEARTHYETLGVAVKATPEQVKAAHRALASILHPDRCQTPAAAEAMACVNVAYTCLSDRAARTLYDTRLGTLLEVCPACEGRGVTYKSKGFSNRVATACRKCEGRGVCG